MEGGGEEMRRGFEDSNQTCCDINTAQSGNLVGKIRYDYRGSASGETVAAKSNQATVRSHFKVNQRGEVLDFGERCSLLSYKEDEGGGIHLNIRNMFETCRDTY